MPSEPLEVHEEVDLFEVDQNQNAKYYDHVLTTFNAPPGAGKGEP